MIIIHIDYDEIEQDSYRAVILHDDDGTKQRFASGDVVKDWQDAIIACADEFAICSSSVDHFLMDGDKFILNEHSLIARNHD